MRPARAAHKPILEELQCVPQPDPSGFHAKNPYWMVPGSCVNTVRAVFPYMNIVLSA